MVPLRPLPNHPLQLPAGDGSRTDRRRFLAALAAAALTAPSLVACATRRASAISTGRWPAVQGMVDGYVADGKVAGAAVAVSYGGTLAAYCVAGQIALDSPDGSTRTACAVSTR